MSVLRRDYHHSRALTVDFEIGLSSNNCQPLTIKGIIAFGVGGFFVPLLLQR